VKYLEWCLDVVDESIMLNKSIASLDMNFLKELSLGEVVEIHESNTESLTVFSITKERQSVFALAVNWK
jgi:medium-chain acyl-[acyl-carrier-protein] hydrolase